MRNRYKLASYIYGNTPFVSFELNAFMAKLGMKPQNIIEPNENVKYLPVEKDRIDVLKSLSKTLIFADDVSNYVAGEGNNKVRFSCPIIRGSQISTHMPFVGLRGADYIREYIDEYIPTLM